MISFTFFILCGHNVLVYPFFVCKKKCVLFLRNRAFVWQFSKKGTLTLLIFVLICMEVKFELCEHLSRLIFACVSVFILFYSCMDEWTSHNYMSYVGIVNFRGG